MKLLSKAKVKLFASLSSKKNRYKHRMFPVEGRKMYQEACLSGWPIAAVIVRESLVDSPEILTSLPADTPCYYTDEATFQALSQLVTPEGVLTIVHFPRQDFTEIPSEFLPAGPGFLLDSIQDPGNLGTIMRIADWFGFAHVLCSKGTVDFLNAKTLRSSMGAVFRVKVAYIDNWENLFMQSSGQSIWVADMDGENLTAAALGAQDYILLGNEANGVSDSLVESSGLKRVHIPGAGGAESLNVSVAGGILAWELARNNQLKDTN